MKAKPEPKLDPTKCSEIILRYDRGWFRGKAQCTRKWSVKAKDGKVYCKQHDPNTIKKRDQVRLAKHDYESAKRAMGWFGCALYDALLELRTYQTLKQCSDAIRKAKSALKEARPYRDTIAKGKPK